MRQWIVPKYKPEKEWQAEDEIDGAIEQSLQQRVAPVERSRGHDQTIDRR